MPRHDEVRLVRNLHVLSSLARTVLEDGFVEAVGLHGVTFGQINILKLLDRSEPRRAKEIAQFIAASKPAATQLLQRMKRHGMIVMRRSAADARAEQIRLTARGRKILRTFERRYRQRLRRLLGDATPSEINRISEGLEAAASLLLRDGERVSEVCLRCGLYEAPACIMKRHGYRCPVEGGCG